MASSLILGPFDLLDPASPVILQPGFDRGAPAPTVSEIQSVVLDGAAVTGRAAGNRHITLPLVIRAADRLTAAQTANQVLAFVDQASWQLTFTPDGGLPVVYDCYRAVAGVTSDLIGDAQGWQAFTVQCEALPYGRSPNTVTVPLAGSSLSVEGFEATPEPVTVTAVQGTYTSKARVSTPTPPVGAYGLQVTYTMTHPVSGNPAAQLRVANSATLSAALTFAPAVAKIYVRASSATMIGIMPQGFWTLTLTTNAGTFTASTDSHQPLLSSSKWQALTFDVSAIPSTATVTGWTLTTQVMQYSTWNGGAALSLYFDDLRIYPSAVAGVSSANGGVYLLPGVQGSARTPINLALSPSSGVYLPQWFVHIPPADTPDAQPLIPFGGAASGAAYTTAATVRYGGTYSVWLLVASVSTGTARTFTVTFSQSGTPAGFTNPSVSLTTSAAGLKYLGEVTLPILAYPDEASPTTTATVTSTVGADTFGDMLLLDTRGQTVYAWPGAALGENAWIDEPDPTVAFGGVWQGATRATAYSAAPDLFAASTLIAEPGDNQIVLWDTLSAPVGTVTYSPRWLQEATS